MSAARWLTRPIETRATSIADRLVERTGVRPPIPVEDLVRRYAELNFAPWPYDDCDALVVALGSSRPRVFVRDGLPFRRQRFTLAHELGHLVIAWHVGTIGCHPDGESGQARGAPVSGSLPSALADRYEKEATEFASRVLLPESYLRDALRDGGMPAGLAAVDAAKVSALAGVLALARLLLPGFVFLVEVPDGWHSVLSSGTSLPPRTLQGNSEDHRALRGLSMEDSTQVVSGKTVAFYRLIKFEPTFRADVDPRDTSRLLRDAILSAGVVGAPAEALFKRISSVVGGSLSKPRASDPGQALAILLHKVDAHRDLDLVSTQADFSLYLRRKALKHVESLEAG